MATLQEMIAAQLAVDHQAAYKDRQHHAKRLATGAANMTIDAENLLAGLATDAQPGGALEFAADLHAGWMSVELPLASGAVAMDAALTELIARAASLRAYMAEMQAAYAALGLGSFFDGLR